MKLRRGVLTGSRCFGRSLSLAILLEKNEGLQDVSALYCQDETGGFKLHNGCSGGDKKKLGIEQQVIHLLDEQEVNRDSYRNMLEATNKAKYKC